MLCAVLAAAACGCVQIEGPATGLVRREGPADVLPAHEGPAAGVEVGELDLPLYQLERMSVRGNVVAFAYGQTVRLVDFAPGAAGVPALRELFRADDGSVRLMLGRTGAGFPVVTTRARGEGVALEAMGSAASGDQELPRAAWLQDDGSLIEIESGLPAGKGVECWTEMGTGVSAQRPEMMVSASRVDERPALYVVQRGKAVLASPLVSGVTEIVSATDGAFALVIAEVTSVVLWPSGVTSHQLATSNAVGPSARSAGGRGATPLLWPGLLGASGGGGSGGAVDVPGLAAIYESGAQRVWLHGAHPTMALRLPAQVQQIAAFGDAELAAMGEGNVWRLRIEAQPRVAAGGDALMRVDSRRGEESAPARAIILGFVLSTGTESLLGRAGVAFAVGARPGSGRVVLVRESPGRVSVRLLGAGWQRPD